MKINKLFAELFNLSFIFLLIMIIDSISLIAQGTKFQFNTIQKQRVYINNPPDQVGYYYVDVNNQIHYNGNEDWTLQML
ncbi:MAG: hypothetical protein A2X64_09915 [Ignavibacteria bacterium GWF2_33_9]|nr:MAG: hypothetical protein A2X64_09915 [Ignavibacteria bacterium GWF2_33_9]